MYVPWRARRAAVPFDFLAGFRAAFVDSGVAGALFLAAAFFFPGPRILTAVFIGKGTSPPVKPAVSALSGFRASPSSARVDCSSARSVKIGRDMEPPAIEFTLTIGVGGLQS